MFNLQCYALVTTDNYSAGRTDGLTSSVKYRCGDPKFGGMAYIRVQLLVEILW